MELLYTFVFMLCRMTPYLLLGFVVSGIMHEFVPSSFFRKHLAEDNFKSVLIATLIGIPLPLCSCGVIPTGIQMRKEGASKGATVAFLVSTPQIGIDSVIATYSLMGLPFAICRPIVALFSALGGGVVTTYFGKDEIRIETRRENDTIQKSFVKRIMSMLRYAFVDMIQNIGKWLLIGLSIGSLITVFVPDGLMAELGLPSIVTMLVVLLVAVPMYTCSMGSIPIAAAMILKGMSPGTALVLLVAGPAVSIASIMVVGNALGRKQMLFFLGSVVIGSLAGGMMIDMLPREWFDIAVSTAGEDGCKTLSMTEIVCTVLFSILFIYAFVLKFFGMNGDLQGKEMSTVYRVDGMSCNHCKASVERAVSAIDGVTEATADLGSKSLTVVGTADVAVVEKAVKDLGFEFGGKI